jgi:hypothetical protein
VKTSGGRKPTYDLKIMIALTDGEMHRVGKMPIKEYEKGQKIRIVRSYILGNVKEILLLKEKRVTKESLSLVSITYIYFSIIFSFIVSSLSFFLKSKYVDILLVALTMAITIFSIIHIFYY